jgi:3'(2'), 5'-bisphosphate nucleotidase
MPIDIHTPELRFALDAAQRAGQLAQRIQTSLSLTGVEKKDLSPVTVADFSCQAIVAQALRAAFPDAVLVGEEDSGLLKEAGQADVLALVTQYVQEMIPDATSDTVCDWIDAGNGEACDRFWTLDPIDGTKGYLRGEQYAVALALIENGQVTLGVLACPNLGMNASPEVAEEGTLLIAQRGQGCWRAPMSDPTQLTQIHVSTCSDIEKARLLRSVESGHTNTGTMGTLVEAMNIEAAPVCLDSQAKYAVLACGGGEALLRLLSSSRPDYREMIWDQAAGSIVIEEAGGRITDLAGQPLDFGQGTTLANNRGVCASNGVLHDTILKALAKHA